MTTSHDLPPLPELGRPFYGPDVQEYALSAIAPYKAENAKLREQLQRAISMPTASEAARNVALETEVDKLRELIRNECIDHSDTCRCPCCKEVFRIDAALGETP